MTYKEAADILDPDTSREALAPYSLDCQMRLAVVNEACAVAARVLRDTALMSAMHRVNRGRA